MKSSWCRKNQGGLTVPEIRYPHFDPLSEQYVQAAAPPITVTVAGADGSPKVSRLPASEAAEQQGPVMRPLKKAPPSPRQADTGLTDNVVYWAAWGIPVLVVAGAVYGGAGVQRRKQPVPKPNGAAPCPTLGRRCLAPYPPALIRRWRRPKLCCPTFPPGWKRH